MAGVSPVGPRDADHVIRDGSCDLTADENITFTLLGGNTRTAPLSVYVLVPEISSCDNLVVTVTSTTSNKKYSVTHTDAISASSVTAPFILELPLPFTSATAWNCNLNVECAAEDFGATQVWIALASEGDGVPNTP